MIKRAALLCLTMYLAFTLTGCGAIFLGSTRTIDVSGSPDGAEIMSQPSVGSFTVPTSLKLTRGEDYQLTFRKAGYREQTVFINKKLLVGTLLADILLTPFLIGVLVDAIGGNWYGHTPTDVTVSLEKSTMGVVGPDKIEIHLTQSSSDKSQILIEGDSGVRVELTETK